MERFLRTIEMEPRLNLFCQWRLLRRLCDDMRLAGKIHSFFEIAGFSVSGREDVKRYCIRIFRMFTHRLCQFQRLGSVSQWWVRGAEVAKLKGTKKTKEESISLSFNFDGFERTSKEEFEIDISKLKVGRHELRVQVTDKVSLQKKIRTGIFEVIQ